MISAPSERSVLAAIGFNQHELLPGLAILRPLATPSKVVVGDDGITCAGESMCAYRLLETVSDGRLIQPNATKLFWAVVYSSSTTTAKRD